MNIDDNGYTKDDILTTITDTETFLRSLRASVNTNVGSTYFDIIKTFALVADRLQTLIGAFLNQLSPLTARSFVLDQYGIDRDVIRRGQQYAIGYVRCTCAPLEITIPQGSSFSSSNCDFITSESAVLHEYLEMTRQILYNDSVPTPYSNLDAIEWCNTKSNRTGTEYVEGVDFNYADDTISWVVGHGPAEGVKYYVGISGTIDITISIISTTPGEIGNVAATTITANNSGITQIQAVTNDAKTEKGAEIEDDDTYRGRIIAAPMRTTVPDKIVSTVLNVDGVRSCSYEQNWGVDQAFPTDWTTPPTGTVQVTNKDIAQTWKPSQGMLNNSKFILYGRKTLDDASPLTLSCYLMQDTYANTIAGSPIKTALLKNDDVDPDDPFGFQQINVDMKFGPVDWTRQYLTLIQESGMRGDWQLCYSTTGSYADGQMYLNGTGQVNSDLFFKTAWDGSGYTLRLAIEEGYEYDDVAAAVEEEISTKGYSTICIQRSILEAEEVHVNVEGTLYLASGYTLTGVANNIDTAILSYLRLLKPGDNVIYSQIYKAIMNTAGVYKVSNMQIKRNADAWKASDLLISPNEVSILCTNVVYGPGTSFTRGY